jgi:endonuclease/exonuclease/phosphatase family metal-dependent hydrolase
LTKPKQARDLRVLTLNLFGRRSGWADRREVIAAGIRHLQPDLVAFLESIKTSEYDQAFDLLGPDYHLAHQSAREVAAPPDVEAGQGFTLASRWPIKALSELDLHVTPRTADFACGSMVAEIDISDPIGPVLFALHLPSWQLDFEYERELQAVVVARKIEELRSPADVPVVLAGDLDADPAAASIRFWTGRQSLQGMSICYRDAWESAHPADPGHTFTPDNPLMNAGDWPFRRIDYIFVRCGLHEGPTLSIRSCERAFDHPIDGTWASDHYGLVADLHRPDMRN